MTKHHFTLKEVFTFGWNKTMQHAWFIFLTFIISSVVLCATALNPIINTVTGLMVVISLASISLMIARNHSFTFSDLFTPLLSPRRVLRFFALFSFYILPTLLAILTFTILIVGAASGSAPVATFGLLLTIAFFVPSVYVAVRFKFFPFVVIEHEHSNVKDLVMMSYKLTENNFWPLFGFILAAAAINLLGLLAFVIGLLVTVPTTFFAAAHLYDKLKNHTA